MFFCFKNCFSMYTIPYAILTLFVHLLALSLVIYRLTAFDKLSLADSNKIDFIAERISMVFLLLCILFVLILAILLLINQITLKRYFICHSVFWMIQFFGFLAFRLILVNITPYARIDLYGRFVKLFSYDSVSYLLLFPIIFQLLKASIFYFKKRIHKK